MNDLRILASAMLLAAGLARIADDDAPRIASVRLAELVAEHAAEAARGSAGAEGTAAATRLWAHALEDALGKTAARHGAVLLPARAVAAGAPDLTVEVRAESLRAFTQVGTFLMSMPFIMLIQQDNSLGRFQHGTPFCEILSARQAGPRAVDGGFHARRRGDVGTLGGRARVLAVDDQRAVGLAQARGDPHPAPHALADRCPALVDAARG